MSDFEKDISRLGTIVSKTDLKGTILEVNDAFVDASGYLKEELIGQPHNILRHPDVPKAVFKDMWATLQSGKPWVQIVKNRCKDGQYYWVEANVTPILENGKIIGFLSVRRAISEETKAAAAKLYKEIHRGNKQITNGYVLDPLQRMCLFNRFHPINLMVMMIGVMGLLLILAGFDVFTLHGGWALLLGLGFLAFSLAGRTYAFKRLGRAKVVMDMMREGNFTGQVDFYGDHSLSRLIAAVKMMQVQLGAMVDEAKNQLERTTRLRSALHSASANMMMINKRGRVLYLNQQMQKFLNAHRAHLKTISKGFDETQLVGRPISEVFSQPVFADMEHAQESEVVLGELIIHLKIQPVFNDAQQQIGSVIEWVDLTQQRKIENNLKDTLEMAALGHTNLSINTTGLSGFFLDTSNHINSLLIELNSIIENMVMVMTNLATGDLRGRVEKDLQGSLAAMKGATNVSLDNLSGIVLYIKRATETVSSAAKESSAAALDLSDRTQQAAATLEQINASMQMVHGLQKENAAELISVNDMANQAMGENATAKSALEATVSAIEDIQQTSEKISNIISLIDGIAFQTNLLALNAAVEAARAGDHGRGFAVVAGEVRSLAQKSATAAQEIKLLIDESVSKVQQGVSKVQETNQAFEIVNEKVTSMGTALDKVVLSIKEQQHSVTEVATAIGHLDSNIQSNAALVEETSSAAESLKEQAILLGKETSKFLIDEQMAHALIQNSSEFYGVNLSDVRQSMRIWRTNAQSFLNGVNVQIDVEKAINPDLCNVGVALEKIAQAAPSIQSSSEFKKTVDLHLRQHRLVKQVIDLMQTQKESESNGVNVALMKEKDALLDEFVLVTQQLDQALSRLEAIEH
ncbi:methyl-accepting chemotaxis protein [Thiosulfativibrio zosterae]|uniref:Methyl-accepting chemotaxis protein n=1 Tax=Thiosulfativibrio zosterae TaxID=2675053 RepID=A0A6F8PNV2_9GAMM|nr:methyl-accepting chemotaxis protein [Thiosulfativibrio zosterae]BBP43724.1 hypothetical protein THMIRHAT_14700 [Thiosulfativibrio zosterae]